MTPKQQAMIRNLWASKRHGTWEIAQALRLEEWQVANFLARLRGRKTEPHPGAWNSVTTCQESRSTPTPLETKMGGPTTSSLLQ